MGLVGVARGQELPYEREQPIGLPETPREYDISVRGGLEVGVGWRPGAGGPLGRAVLDVGLGVDRLFKRRLALGGRLAWLTTSAADDGTGESLDALELGARARVGLVPWRKSDRYQLEVETSAGLRLASVGPHHAVAGLGLTVSRRHMRFGLRYTRALSGDAAAGNLVFAVAEWMTPAGMRTDGWPHREHDDLPRVGLGLHVIAAGYSVGALGASPPGAAIELPVYFGGPTIIALARWDLLWFPFADQHTVRCDSVLAGAQWYLQDGPGFAVGALFGYSVDHGDAPHAAAEGLVADAGVTWIDTMGLHYELHARFGVEPGSEDLRAVFVSVGARQIFR